MTTSIPTANHRLGTDSLQSSRCTAWSLGLCCPAKMSMVNSQQHNTVELTMRSEVLPPRTFPGLRIRESIEATSRDGCDVAACVDYLQLIEEALLRIVGERTVEWTRYTSWTVLASPKKRNPVRHIWRRSWLHCCLWSPLGWFSERLSWFSFKNGCGFVTD